MFFPMPQASFWCKYRVGHFTCHREVPSGLCSDAVAFRGFFDLIFSRQCPVDPKRRHEIWRTVVIGG